VGSVALSIVAWASHTAAVYRIPNKQASFLFLHPCCLLSSASPCSTHSDLLLGLSTVPYSLCLPRCPDTVTCKMATLLLWHGAFAPRNHGDMATVPDPRQPPPTSLDNIPSPSLRQPPWAASYNTGHCAWAQPTARQSGGLASPPPTHPSHWAPQSHPQGPLGTATPAEVRQRPGSWRRPRGLLRKRRAWAPPERPQHGPLSTGLLPPSPDRAPPRWIRGTPPRTAAGGATHAGQSRAHARLLPTRGCRSHCCSAVARRWRATRWRPAGGG